MTALAEHDHPAGVLPAGKGFSVHLAGLWHESGLWHEAALQHRVSLHKISKSTVVFS